ncbi:hypothetical protein CC1G_15361 [Coprinopsis cinerea okayama7|uniref:Uncharacterized protein n=1 Tax=Coprinopsis cinerea (strain Okayama-7 / 130 / ATCC MYA-4618 / FGSC 9003) TaxID=240176 RepID=D6RQ40_COPC7|nr:hypothetical protein CC1G_15361 [Coprinopsis cinerea okayama7\|eukprot:XP_002910454.1 hypothetical protein CC1G_15361 [Coprinopsis cinerea okayama7\
MAAQGKKSNEETYSNYFQRVAYVHQDLRCELCGFTAANTSRTGKNSHPAPLSTIHRDITRNPFRPPLRYQGTFSDPTISPIHVPASSSIPISSHTAASSQ